VRNRFVISAVLGTALLLVGFVTPAAAQAPGASIGAGISFLSVPDETGVGFTVDVAKEFAVMGKAAIAGVGDFSFHSFDDFSATSYGGGVRVIGKMTKANLFGQVLFGGFRQSASDCDGEGCSSNNFMITPGIGVDFAATDKVMIRGQVDFVQVNFEDGWDNATRFWFGVVFGFGR
jgi:hypothetical protein